MGKNKESRALAYIDETRERKCSLEAERYQYLSLLGSDFGSRRNHFGLRDSAQSYSLEKNLEEFSVEKISCR